MHLHDIVTYTLTAAMTWCLWKQVSKKSSKGNATHIIRWALVLVMVSIVVGINKMPSISEMSQDRLLAGHIVFGAFFIFTHVITGLNGFSKKISKSLSLNHKFLGILNLLFFHISITAMGIRIVLKITAHA